MAGDDPHALLHAILTQLTTRLRSPDGLDYLRIVPQLLGPGRGDDDLPTPAAPVEGLTRLEAHLAQLSPSVRSQRLRSMLLVTTTLSPIAPPSSRPEPDRHSVTPRSRASWWRWRRGCSWRSRHR